MQSKFKEIDAIEFSKRFQNNEDCCSYLIQKRRRDINGDSVVVSKV